MIYLYSGTPGSGKSLHCAKLIYNGLKHSDGEYICNFPINSKYFTKEEYSRFHYVGNDVLRPKYLVEFAEEYWKHHKVRNVAKAERQIRVFIDEAQLLFNAREWMKSSKDGWPQFFSVHRHLGFEVVMVSQMDTMLDKQVRGLIEYNCIHRKISNIGMAGKIVGALFGGGLFYYCRIWYPQQERIGGEFFTFSKKLDSLYDTHALFTSDSVSQAVISVSGKARREDATRCSVSDDLRSLTGKEEVT